MGKQKYQISERDKRILRSLAQRVAIHAADPLQDKKRKLWTLHNDLKTDEPVVFIDPENGWGEIFPAASLQCENEIARGWELELRKRLFHVEHLKDDMVIDNVFSVPFVSTDDGWGVEIIREGAGTGKAYHVTPAIEEYEDDFEKLHFPNIIINEAESDLLLEAAQDTFNGILTVDRYMQWWWSMGMTCWFIDLRGLENFLCDFLLEPEWMHRMMNMFCDGVLDQLDKLEKQGLLYSNNGNRYVGSGGYGFTDTLPKLSAGTLTSQMWGFVESQETSTVSHDMYGEFIFPYHKKITDRFGLNCYGCCEPFEGRWKYVSQISNLRRVSCSPWSDREKAADILKGNYIASHKLSPTPLASPQMNEAEVRKNIREVLDHASGTVPELIMKDNHTLGGQPRNAVRWVELVREEIANT